MATKQSPASKAPQRKTPVDETSKVGNTAAKPKRTAKSGSKVPVGDKGPMTQKLEGWALVFPDDQQESEDDLGKVSYRGAVVTNVDWTIESIHLQMDKGTVDVQPSFQRRAAWDNQRKSRLIESIIVGMPVPNLVLAENKEHRGRFIVIDGKQRLLAIQEFIQGGYKLTGLDLRDDLNQKRYTDLEQDDKEAFENSTIRTTLIKSWQDEKFLWAAFYRLNVGSLPLSPQELRKALIGGKLLEEIEAYLTESKAFQAIFGTQLDKRMRDSELVLRFLAFDRNLQRYKGDFKKFLDETAKFYEVDWARRRAEVKKGLARLDVALEATSDIFGEYAFKKWVGDGYERVMNRAIFDCVARYFSDPEIADLARQRSSKVLMAYERSCNTIDFRDAIERTTKTVPATTARLFVWGVNLSKALGKTLNTETWRIE